MDTLVESYLNRPSKMLRDKIVKLGFAIVSQHQPDDSETKALNYLGRVLEEIHSGSLVIDDIQDGSDMRRGKPSLHIEYGEASAICLGNWMYFRAISGLPHLGLSESQKVAIYEAYMRTLDIGHRGQMLDLNFTPERHMNDLENVVHCIHRFKTGGLVGFGFFAGAVVADQHLDRDAALLDIGVALGVAVQRFNDIKNLATASPDHIPTDLKDLRPSFLWGVLERPHAQSLLEAVHDEDAEGIFQIIQSVGGVKGLVTLVDDWFKASLDSLTTECSGWEVLGQREKILKVFEGIRDGYFKGFDSSSHR